MLERLKLLLLLATSRKVVVALIATLVLWANAHYALGLPGAVQEGVVFLAIAIIGGIAAEDIGAMKARVGRFDGAAPTSAYERVTQLLAQVLEATMRGGASAPPPDPAGSGPGASSAPPSPAAAPSAPGAQSGRALRGFLLWGALIAGLVLTAVTGCWTVHRRSARDIRGMDVRQDAELGRLHFFLSYEQSKHDED